MHHHYSTLSEKKPGRNGKNGGTLFQYFKKVPKTGTESESAVASVTPATTTAASSSQPVTRSTKTTASSSSRPGSSSIGEDDDLIYTGTKPVTVNSNAHRGFSISSSNSNTTTAASQGSCSARMFGSQGSNTEHMIIESKFKSSSVNPAYKNKPRFSSVSPQPDPETTKTGFHGGSQPLKRVTLAERTTPAPKPSGMMMSQHDPIDMSAKEPTFPPGVLSRPPRITTRKPESWQIVGTNSAETYQTSNTVRQSPPQQQPKNVSYETMNLAMLNLPRKRRNLDFFHYPPPSTSTTSTTQSFEKLKNNYLYHGRDDFAKSFKATSTPRKSFSANKRRAAGGSTFPRNAPEFRPVLSDEQQRVLDKVVNQRESIFFTGSAGTGKSVLLRAIIERLRDKFDNAVAVTASTGIAACNINGSTLHSFAGIGLGKERPDILVQKIKERKKQADRWRNTRVLIIDEVSMVDGELFDKLEYIARALKNNSEPFGGIQLVVSGDFYQLPPVNPNGPTVFAFEAKSWNTVIKNTVMLRKVFRQKDELFVSILNQMRVGILSDKAISIFRSLSRVPDLHSDIQPTELYPLRRDVDASNNARLEALPGVLKTFKSHDSGDPKRMDYFLAPGEIKLKINAQVMLLKNMDQSLVNGSLGIVVGFAGEGAYESSVKVRNRLAPNRYQGMNDEPDMDKIMSRGYPIVKFANNREVVIETESWSFELPNGEVIASRIQLPLMLAWAMSIHKSQGQTLDSVRVDLGEVFEMGQAYVALSRATSLESLQILRFDPSKVKAHGKVVDFYRSLSTL